MPRHPKPWYRRSADAWYVQVGGKKVLLAKGKDSQALAWAAFHRLQASGGQTVDARAEGPPLTLANVCELFLGHSKAVHKPKTYDTNRGRLERVTDDLGGLAAASLTLSAVERWAAGLGVSSETRRDYLSTLRAALRWAVREGYLPSDPLAGLKLPPRTRRERTLAPAEREAMRGRAHPAVQDLLLVLEQTGCRPMVAAMLEARHVDWQAGTAALESKGRRYTLILPERLLGRLRELAAVHPTGPLLRGRRGQPWTYNAIRCQFRRLRVRAGISGVSAYTYRHSYITDALEHGVNPAALAVLVGHSDLSMIARHYSHLAERRGALRAAAEAAAAAAGQPAPAPPAPGPGRSGEPGPAEAPGSPPSPSAGARDEATRRGRKPTAKR